MAVQLTYHGTKPQSASNILSQGFRTGRLRSIAPGQIFSSNAPGFSSGYGSGTVRMVTPTSTFSLPSKNLATGVKGREFITSPKAGTRMANLASKLGTQYTGPTAGRLAAGQTVTGLGGRIAPSLLGTAARFAGPVGLGITAAQAGAELGDWAYKNWEPATKFGDWAGGGIYDFLNPKETSIDPTGKNLFTQHGYEDDEYDFSGIEGHTAFLGVPQLFGLIKGGISKQAIKKAIIQNQIQKQIGKKTRPFITKKLREARGETFGGTGKFKNIATGTKDYGPHTKTKTKTKYTSPSPHRNGGGGGGSTGQATSKSSGKNYGPYSKADGGLINFYRYGGFV